VRPPYAPKLWWITCARGSIVVSSSYACGGSATGPSCALCHAAAKAGECAGAREGGAVGSKRLAAQRRPAARRLRERKRLGRDQAPKWEPAQLNGDKGCLTRRQRVAALRAAAALRANSDNPLTQKALPRLELR
jgi:hypothetical protein